MAKNYIYALTWLNYGADGNDPTAQTMAVSEDKDKLIAEMERWVKLDCEEVKREDYESDDEYEEDAWNDDKNFVEHSRFNGVEVMLRHRKYTELYTSYRITSVELL